MVDGWVLVVGYGSIGRRHFNNLKLLGVSDVRLLRTTTGRPGAFDDPPETTVYRELDAALADRPVAVVVANPTSLHFDTARAALRAGVHVLLEKPVCADLDSARALLAETKSLPAVCSVAYCFRYHPLYKRLHDETLAGRVGRPFHAHTWQGQFLPAWHPWEDYRTSYAARADLGGGVVRTLDHDLDLLRWTMGQPASVLASAGSISGIGVPVEDTADMIFRWPDRRQGAVHLCFARGDYFRGMWVVGEQGSLTLDWGAGALTIVKGRTMEEVVSLPKGYDLNRMYVDMLRDALAGFAASPPRAAVPLDSGVAALEMSLAALESSAAGRVVQLQGAT